MDLRSGHSLVLVFLIHVGSAQMSWTSKKRDKAMRIDVLHAIQTILHAEWGKTSDPKIKRQIAEMGTWIIGGFCVGLRGEEMLLIEFAGWLRV